VSDFDPHGFDPKEPFAFLQYGWQMQYLGAFVVLRILNGATLLALTDSTRSDKECANVLQMLRDGKGDPQDRAFRALRWLQDERKKETVKPS
jgi:hypothetical protein